MNTLISFLAINWSVLRDGVAIFFICAILGVWYLCILFSVRTEKSEQKDLNTLKEENAMPVDFPQPLVVKFSKTDECGEGNHMKWSLYPDTTWEDLVINLQKFLEARINEKRNISIKVHESGPEIWISFKKKSEDLWDDVFIEGKECLETFFEKITDFKRVENEVVASS